MEAFDDQLSTYQGRLNTFIDDWPFKKSEASLSKYEMAKAGFYYLKGDCVKCYYCSKELEGWEAEDNAFEEHRNHAGYCPFVKMFAEPPVTLTMHQAINLECSKLILEINKSYNDWLAQFQQANKVGIQKVQKFAKKKKFL